MSVSTSYENPCSSQCCSERPSVPNLATRHVDSPPSCEGSQSRCNRAIKSCASRSRDGIDPGRHSSHRRRALHMRSRYAILPYVALYKLTPGDSEPSACSSSCCLPRAREAERSSLSRRICSAPHKASTPRSPYARLVGASRSSEGSSRRIAVHTPRMHVGASRSRVIHYSCCSVATVALSPHHLLDPHHQVRVADAPPGWQELVDGYLQPTTDLGQTLLLSRLQG